MHHMTAALAMWKEEFIKIFVISSDADKTPQISESKAQVMAL